MRTVFRIVATAVVAGLIASPAIADITVGVGLDLSGDAEVKTSLYDCTGRDAPLAVRYVNASPNFLALVPVDGQTLIFANVLAASGAKYESSQYIWWTKGADASLFDVTEGLDAAPVLSCSEQIDTP